MSLPLSRFDGPELARTAANHMPLSFLRRTALVYLERLAVVQGDLRRTWRDVDPRCRRLAHALIAWGGRAWRCGGGAVAERPAGAGGGSGDSDDRGGHERAERPA